MRLFEGIIRWEIVYLMLVTSYNNKKKNEWLIYKEGSSFSLEGSFKKKKYLFISFKHQCNSASAYCAKCKTEFSKIYIFFLTGGKEKSFIPQHIRTPPAAGSLCILSSLDISLESFCSALSLFACLRPRGFTITEKNNNKKNNVHY